MKIALLAPLALALAASAPNVVLGGPLGVGFVYQGELIENGLPLTGTAHLRFSLYDAPGSGSPPVGGAPIGASHVLSDVPVTDGIFTVLLNEGGQFGASAFNGQARWIQLEVCDDASCTSSTVLGPRQPVTGIPYALTAAKPWVIAGTNLSYSDGYVGIGTTAPESRLHVTAGFLGDGVRLVGGAGTDPAYHLYDGAFGRASLALAMAPGLWSTDAVGGDIVLRSTAGKLLLQNGILGSALAISGNNVGLGTASPSARLDVRGDVKLGPGGQYFAPSGEENLRMMRGEVAGDGSSPLGCCFSCVRSSTGVYDITFSDAFADVPIVTVTPRSGGIAASTVSLGSGAVRVLIYLDGVKVNSAFQFIALGQR